MERELVLKEKRKEEELEMRRREQNLKEREQEVREEKMRHFCKFFHSNSAKKKLYLLKCNSKTRQSFLWWTV